MRLQSGFRSLAMVILFLAPPLEGQLEILHQTETGLTGGLPVPKIEFSSSLESPNTGLVEITISEEIEIRTEINYDTRQVSVKSLIPGTLELTALREADVIALDELQSALAALQPDPDIERLLRTLNFLSVYGEGLTVDVTSPPSEASKAITSLCAATGSRRAGTYDVEEETFRESVQVGPCYSQPNECMGRCGPGCRIPPSATIQIFAQDCLNHDLCTRRTGTILGECADEWAAASDDFLIGRDCGDLDGRWTDNYTFSWDLQDVSGLLTGTVSSQRCARRTVSGLHSGPNITLTARLRRGNEQCCRSFTYKGKAASCNQASGTWTNECGFRGNWSLLRNGRGAQLTVTNEHGQEVSPEEVRPH